MEACGKKEKREKREDAKMRTALERSQLYYRRTDTSGRVLSRGVKWSVQ
jgi:hypothetical protein